LHLVRDYGPAESLLRVLPTREREVADAGVADEALVENAPHAVHRRTVQHERVGPVHLVQVDDIDAEPAGTGMRPLPDDRRQRHQLRSKDHIAASAANRRAENALRLAVPVGLGRINEVDAEVKGPLGNHAGFVTRVVVAVTPVARAELPAAQPDDRHPGAVHLDEAHSTNGGATIPDPPPKTPATNP